VERLADAIKTGPYDNVDAGVKDTVRMFNEVLGLKTMASCAGGDTYDGACASYIAIDYKGDIALLADHLIINNFIVTSQRRILDKDGRTIGRELNLAQHPLYASILISKNGAKILRMEVTNFRAVTLGGLGGMTRDDRPWPVIRHDGWNTWLHIIQSMLYPEEVT